MRKKALAIVISLLALVSLSACDGTIPNMYPCLVYRNSDNNFDMLNQKLPIKEGHVLNNGHSYDVVETEDGYDLIVHFTKND